MNREIENITVKNVYDSFPKNLTQKMLNLRELIYLTADGIESIGTLNESLKWNEPSYSPTKPKVGSPIRLNIIVGTTNYAIFFNCKTNLVSTFKQIYPDLFNYGGNRSILFNINDLIPIKELSHCISLALTYHLRKKEYRKYFFYYFIKLFRLYYE